MNLLIGSVIGAVFVVMLLFVSALCGVVRKLNKKLLASEAENARLRLIASKDEEAFKALLARATAPVTVTLTEDGCLKIGARLLGAIEVLYASQYGPKQ